MNFWYFCYSQCVPTMFPMNSQHISQVPKIFLIAYDFYPILVFLGEDWRPWIFIVHNVFPHDPIEFPMCFSSSQGVPNSTLVLFHFFLTGRWGGLGLFGFLFTMCSHYVPNESPMCFSSSQYVPNSTSLLSHIDFSFWGRWGVLDFYCS